MSNGKIAALDRDMLNDASRLAKESPRKRKNSNLHSSDTDACHRLLNAIEPDSYVVPHCHADPAKDETIIALRGKLGVVVFDDNGAVVEKLVIQPKGQNVGVNIPHGVFHSMAALEADTIFFESKAGPYHPLGPAEKAAWAPQEGAPDAASYHAGLRKLFE